MFRKSLIAALLGLGFGATAQAGLVGVEPAWFSFKGSWAAFDAAVNVTATAGSLVNDYSATLALSDLPASVAGLSISTIGVTGLSGGGTLNTGGKNANNGRFSVSDDVGTEDPQGVFIEGGATALTITFGAAIEAFGFWGTDIGDFAGECQLFCPSQGSSAFTVQLLDGSDNLLGTFSLNGTGTDGSADYYGFVGSASHTFTKVIITNSTVTTDGGTTDGQGFSRFSVGTADPGTTPVPEPGVLGLVALGLLAAGRKRRAD